MNERQEDFALAFEREGQPFGFPFVLMLLMLQSPKEPEAFLDEVEEAAGTIRQAMAAVREEQRADAE